MWAYDYNRCRHFKMDPQTYWNNNTLDEDIEQFKKWVGGSEAESNTYLYTYMGKHPEYEKIIDMGCGLCSVATGLQENSIGIDYTGIDSCSKFVSDGKKKGFNVLLGDLRQTPLKSNEYDIVFGRHVVEHQPAFELILNEMTRLAKSEVVIIFFIKPIDEDRSVINYDEATNLYHNAYSKQLIINWIANHRDIKSFTFVNINDKESALHIHRK